MNGSLFLEKLVFVWVYFQIPWWHIPTKTKLEYPPGATNTIACAQLSKNAWGTKMQINGLKGSQLAKMKKSTIFLTCPCHEIYRDEAVGLKSCKYT